MVVGVSDILQITDMFVPVTHEHEGVILDQPLED